MRLFVLAITLSLADFAAASAQTATPDSENGRYSFSAVADGVLRLDTRCVYRKSDSAILVMKTAKDRSRCDDAEALNRARERGIFVQRAMNS
jgi:hypothetical protein